MASVSPTSAPKVCCRAAGGFSLAELLVAIALAGVVGAGILSAYTFMARSLARLANYQRLEVESRRALQMLNTDTRMAVSLTAPTTTSVTFAIPAAAGVTTTTVAYRFDEEAQTLTRTYGGTATITLLTGVQTLAFNYYDSRNAISASPQSIKQVDVTFTTATGASAANAQAHFTAASARLLLRNKPLLQ